jgi:glutathione S-transferase
VSDPRWALWGVELSPFALKVEALLRFHGVPYRWMPREGRLLESARLARRRLRLVSGRLPLSWPRMTALDEYPLVPFLFGPAGENLYDSTAIAAWLDARRPAGAPALVPDHEPALRFAVALLDEAFDELGLCLAHHNRWVVAARDNDAGARLAAELRPLLGPLAAGVRRSFPARQVRRLPYLLSVADPADASFADLPPRLRPPARAGFPPTHALLDEAFAALLAAVEPVLATRPFLFGARCTLADASLYGQLGMNRSDPSARARIARAAPATAAWIERLARGDIAGSAARDALRLDEAIAPLLAWTLAAFVPLAQQNHAAWARQRAAGETLWNERAFDRGRALYDGVLLGRPFRSVAKTFQVRVWAELRGAWRALAPGDRARLPLPGGGALDHDGPPPY